MPLSLLRRLLPRICFTCCLLALYLLAAPAFSADDVSPQPGSLLGGGGTSSEPAMASPGIGTRAVAYLWTQQQAFHRRLADAFHAFREQQSAAAAWLLISLAFLYGIFHAAGPGHGKAVITTYLLAHEHDVRRGLLLSSAAALLQGVTAIAVVQILTAVLGLASRDARAAAGYLETLSFALTTGLGALLVLRSGRRLWRDVRGTSGTRHHAHSPHEPHGHHCHHAVGTTRSDGKRAAIGVILSVGLRPCTGALLVLTLANAFAMRAVGIAAVLAMSVGTAAAVAGLATVALVSRRIALAVLRTRATAVTVAGHGIAILGGLFILALGAALLAGSLAGNAGSPLM